MNGWRLRAPEPQAARRLAAEAGVSEIIAGLLMARGIRSSSEAAEFFSPSLAQGHDPFLLRGMERAVDVLVAASRAGERIVVFGDYDVDGVTAVAQLRAVLRVLGADSVPFLPHRIRDGYGLKPETFRKVYEQYLPRAIVTVDCGITAVAAVEEAARAGVAVVITDHHLPPEVLPDGASVVNPKQPGCPYPFKELCGSGVAFKISQAIIRREKLTLSESSLAKVAALGTVADIVPLLGENRGIVAEGLAGLSDARAPGLKALLEEAGISGRAPDAEEIAFRVSPRLNAAGRLDTADLALAVFEEREERRAREIARELSARNADRQAHERSVVEAARRELFKRGDPRSESVLIAEGASWPRGVLGIAAARLAREFHRPCFLFARGERLSVGSARSVPGVPLYETLSEIRQFFSEFGGHAQACGGSVPVERFEDFADRARQLFAERVAPEFKTPAPEAEAEIRLSDVGESLLGELERFEPFGEGNPRPRFLARRVRSCEGLRPVGERGRRGTIVQDGRACQAIAWGLAETWEPLAGQEVDVQFRIRRDRYTGGPDLEIEEMRPAQ
jgi:single-stranded-DNA-specific exonuclease